MVQILRLWRVHAYLDLMFLTRDLRQFAAYAFSDAVETVASVTAILLVAERFNGIGHWSKAQLVFMLGYSAIVVAASQTLFGYNVLWISRRIGRGQLDHTLIQPQPLWRALLTEGFSPVSYAIPLILAGGLTAWAATRLHVPITWAWLALLVLNLAGSMAALLGFSFVWGSLAFWAPVGAEEISSSAINLVTDLKSFPLDGLGRGLRTGLLVAAPAGLLAWLPSRYLAGIEPMGPGALATPAIAAAICLAAALLFGRGMNYYARTGSRRYTSFGHRR